MININGKKIKETLTKGFVLMALTGTLVSKNPIKFNNDVNIVYAADNLEQDKKDALKELKSVYKTYNKKYYSSKNYKKLTKNYNKGVSLIKNSKNGDKVDEYLKKYTDILNGIKPTVLIKYQNKMEKKLLTTYKKLITKNKYSESNLEKIEDLKEQGVEEIHSALTKTKAKKAKNNYITKLNNVKTKIEQIREDAINFINDNKNIDEENKKVLIEQISNNSEENITAILEEYGYVYEEKEIFDETITVEQIDNKIKELLKKYPKYTEDEVRTLVATANMDFVKDEDLLTIFNITSVDEIKLKDEYLKEWKDEYGECAGTQKLYILHPDFSEESNLINARKYEDLIKINDLFINKKLKENANYIHNLEKNMVYNPYDNSGFGFYDNLGNLAGIELVAYIYDDYSSDIDYKKEYTYKYSDSLFDNTGSGYIFKNYITKLLINCSNPGIKSFLPQGDKSISELVNYMHEDSIISIINERTYQLTKNRK